MDAPATSTGDTDRDRRLAAKLLDSPGSFFRERSREFVLPADYFRERLQAGTYGGTATRHYHVLCSASFAMLMSSFELTWKTLFARIVDATNAYDSNLVGIKDSSLTVESILAHRETTGAGSILAETGAVWQRTDSINSRFQAAFKVAPIDSQSTTDLAMLWQVRHIIAHGSGVVSDLDSYRLGGTVTPRRSLLVDGEYLEETQSRLVSMVTGGVAQVGKRLLDDFFAATPTPSWAKDFRVFTRLYLLGVVVGQSANLPDVTEAMFASERASRP